MGTYPQSPRSAFITWAQVHQPIFTANALAIGLTAVQAEAFNDATTAAVARLLAAEEARQAAKVATLEASQAVSALRTSARETVQFIKLFAENSADPEAVYNLAQIPPPASPKPVDPPAQPTDLSVELDPTEGFLTLKWKAANPAGASGTAYIVRRRLPGVSAFTFIGVSGSKSFTDSTLNAGPDFVQYTVQGQRSDLSGPVSNVFTVNFGRTDEGAMTVTGSESVNAKLAA